MIHVGFSNSGTNGGQFTIYWTEFTESAWHGRISGTIDGQNYANAPAKVEWDIDSFTYEDRALDKLWKETFTRSVGATKK